jgi:D-alanyl-D-alanine carboxypeptidase (penicillin-binding protein 5/6)
LLPTTGLEKISSKIVYQGPLQAPVVAGQNIGELIILIPGMPQKILPLVAADSVARGGFISRLRTAALVLLKKVRRDPQDV